MTAPNISAWRRKTAGDLTTTLQVSSHPDTSVPTLPATDARSALVNAQCTAGQLFEVDVPNPAPYPLPTTQSLPVPETGTRPHTPV